MARAELNKSKEQMVARYFNGLLSFIQDIFVLHSLWKVSKSYTSFVGGEDTKSNYDLRYIRPSLRKYEGKKKGWERKKMQEINVVSP